MAAALADAPDGGGCEDRLERITRTSRELPPGDPLWAYVHLALGRELRGCGRLEEAVAAYSRSLELASESAAGGLPVAQAGIELAVLYLDQGRIDAGARLLQRFRKDVESGALSRDLAADWHHLCGIVALSRRLYEAAERELLAAESARLGVRNAAPDRAVSLHAALAMTAAAAGDRSRARRRAEQGLAMIPQLKPGESEAGARAVINLAAVHFLLEDPRRAEPLVALALRLARQYPSVPLHVRASLAESHADLLKVLGRKHEAKAARAELKRIRQELAESERRRHAVDYQELLRAARK